MIAAMFCWSIAVWLLFLSRGDFFLADIALLVGIGFMEAQR